MPVSQSQHTAHTQGLKDMVKSFFTPKPRIKMGKSTFTSTIGKPAIAKSMQPKSVFNPGPVSNGIGVGP